MDWLNHIFLGNSVRAWLIAAGLFVVFWAALAIAKYFIVSRLRDWVQRTSTDIDDFLLKLLDSTKSLFLFIVAFVMASWWLTFRPSVELALHRTLGIAVWLQVLLWGSRLIDFLVARSIQRQERAGASAELGASLRTTMSAVRIAGRIALYVLIFLEIIHNLGFDVTALIAGLGVGGIAVALAIQNILGDLFASLSIVLDKPFVLGDFIIVGDEMGTVDRIGLKTTRVKSLSGEQIVFSNADLLRSRVRNYKRMAERRVVFHFGVLYQTPLDKLKQIPSMIEQIIKAQSPTRFDRAHFQQFGDSSLTFEVVYYVLSADYNLYASIENQINLELYQQFEQQGIGFAYPTRTLYIEQWPERENGQQSPSSQLSPMAQS